MDQIVLDVGDVGVEVGEVATVFGPGGAGDAGEPTIRDWAGWAGTVEHEIVTRIGPRVTRETVGGGAAGAILPLRAVGAAA